MGLTVFDLFGELLTEADMKRFLSTNDINFNDFASTSALAIRCFLLLIDQNRKCGDDGEMQIIPIKEEIMDETDTVQIDTSENNEFYVPVELEEQQDGTKDNRGKFTVRKRKRGKGINLCKGPGCYCEQSFPTRQAKEAHYIEKECFKCNQCGSVHPSQAALTVHIESHSGFRCRLHKQCKALFKTDVERKAHEAEFNHFECEPCRTSYFKHEQLVAHRRTETCKANAPCPVCGFGADLPVETRFTRVNEHKKRCMSGKIKPEREVCDICGKESDHRLVKFIILLL